MHTKNQLPRCPGSGLKARGSEKDEEEEEKKKTEENCDFKASLASQAKAWI